MRIRQAGATDLEALLRLERHFPTDRLSRACFRHLLHRGQAQVWVCEDGGAVVADAVVLYRRGTKTARCYSLVVRPDKRRRGIAQRLLAQAEAAARHRGCHQMRLEVRPDNRAALGFYRKNGYQAVGILAAFYEDGTEALRMRKQIAPAAGTAKAQVRRPRRGALRASALGATAATPAAVPKSPRRSAVA
jgi:ribosomal-protein-alanine N-acetyltransferase